MVRMGVGYEYGIGLAECGIINRHLTHLCHRVHLNDFSVIFEGKGAVKYAGYLQSFPGGVSKVRQFSGKAICLLPHEHTNNPARAMIKDLNLFIFIFLWKIIYSIRI